MSTFISNVSGNFSWYGPAALSVDGDYLVRQVEDLFHRSLWRGCVTRMLSVMLRRPCRLAEIDPQLGMRTHSSHDLGIQAVPLDKICGTLGRRGDFDIHFHPLHERLRQRWVRVALARSRQIPLGPVSLIKVAECYFVQDGHHRLSVARALGEESIDAEVRIF